MIAACSLVAAFVVVAVATPDRRVAAPQDPPPNGSLVVRGATVHTATNALWTGDLEARHGRLVAAGSVRPAHHGAVEVHLPGAFVVPGLQDARRKLPRVRFRHGSAELRICLPDLWILLGDSPRKRR